MTQLLTLGELLGAFNQAGITLAVEGDQLRLRAPVGALTPVLTEAASWHKPTILAVLGGAHCGVDEGQLSVDCVATPGDGDTPEPWAWREATPAYLAEMEELFAQVRSSDLAYLSRPRPTSYCLRCGGRSEHRASCDAEEATMPWGRHKGKPLRDIPGDYLGWLIDTKQNSLPDSFCVAIARLLDKPLRPKTPKEAEELRPKRRVSEAPASTPTKCPSCGSHDVRVERRDTVDYFACNVCTWNWIWWGSPAKSKARRQRESCGCRPCDVMDWQDVGTDNRGWIRTICSRCQKFIGYRPPSQETQGYAMELHQGRGGLQEILAQAAEHPS